jgi:hypothetical protein
VNSPAPTHQTPMGVRLWLLRDGDRALGWSGDYDKIRLYPVIDRPAGPALGSPGETITGRCADEAAARAAAGDWLTRNDSGRPDDGVAATA